MREREDVYDEVVTKLRAAARANRVVEAAQVHLINLSDIISRAGRHWPHVRDRIRSGSVDFLKGCLCDEDIIIPCGDGFLIIFGQGERAELAARCGEIQELLTAFYTGQEGLEALQASVQNRPLEQGSFDTLMREAAAGPSVAETCGGHQIVFTPVWSVRAQLVACHICQPTHCDAGIVRIGYNPSYRQHGRHESEDYSALDLDILSEAVAALAQFVETGQRGIIGATVHVSTLRHQRTRMTYLARLAGAPHALTQRLLIRVAEVEVGAPPFTLADWTGFLRAHVRRVALEYHPAEREYDRMGEIGAWAAGFLLPPHRDAMDAPLLLLRDQIANWTRAAQRQHVKLLIDNFRNAELLHAARDCGLELATSEMFWPSKARPDDVLQALSPNAARRSGGI